MTPNNRIRIHSPWLAVVAGLLLTASSWAENLPISDTPLFLSSAMAPNVFFEVDDSGSMDWEILTRPHWHFCAYEDLFAVDEGLYDPATLAVDDCGWQENDGLWRSYQQTSNGVNFQPVFYYIYPNSDDAYNTNCSNGVSASSLLSCDSDFTTNLASKLDWRILSADFNVVYYNPNVNYAPWSGPCLTDGTTCGNASFDAARSDPRQGTAGYTVTNNLDGFSYEVWSDDKGYSGNRPHRSASKNITTGANGEVDVWDTHTRYTFSGNDVTITRSVYPTSIGSTPTISSSTDSNGNTVLTSQSTLNPTVTTTTLTGSGCFSELYPGDAGKCRTIAEAKQNIANWYQYQRRRSFVAKGAIAEVVSEYPDFRYGLSVINHYNDLFVDVPASTVTSFGSHNSSLLAGMFDLNWPTSGTPLRRGLERVGNYYDGVLNGHADPIIGSCQKNYTVLFTDGYWNGGSPTTVSGDQDGDGVQTTLADVARHYYDTDLSNKPNNVPIDAFDNNQRQHMVTFTVAFGVSGHLEDTDTPKDGWPDDASGVNLTESSDWGNPTGSDDRAKIDDLWHAAYNSRGEFTSARTAAQVADALKKALKSVEQRSSSAASVAINTGLAGGAAALYQARFDSNDWTGELTAIPVNPNTGLPDESASPWEAGNKLPSHGARLILTQDGTGVNNGGGLFRWADLTTAQKDSLRAGLTGTAAEIDAAAQQRLNYLRGDDSQEVAKGGSLRDRPGSKLGDIINSAPIYSGAPMFPYPDTLESAKYSFFQGKYAGRAPMLYVGANDGMLHGFDASTGVERLAYVPNAVIAKLVDLTSPDYSHRFYVDGTPTVGDAFIDPSTPNGTSKSWRTVLAGGLNNGGQAIYALDVTDPSNFTSSNTATVLWEFSDALDNDADGDGSDDAPSGAEPADSMRYALGDTFSRPAIVRMKNGQWAAVFGNGYNNQQADNHASNNGDAVLYILDLGTGKVIRKISTQTGAAEDPTAYLDGNGATVYRHRANGLATTAPVDQDGDHIIDYIYAGDLFGNLWKFDVTDSNPANWKVAFDDGSGKPLPLFTACAGTCTSGVNANYQPITTRLEVGRTQDRYGLMIYFGTGKYLATEDIGDQSVQSFYGIIDKGSRLSGGRATDLTEQRITYEASQSFTNSATGNSYSYKVRSTTDNPLGSSSGWFMDLKASGTTAQGERVVQTPLLRSGRIIFSTLIPTADVCSFGGDSWLMELNAYNGSRLNVSPFDLNHDDKFTTADYVTNAGNQAPPSGRGFGELIPTPGVLNAGDKEYKYTSGSSGKIEVTVESPDPSAFGRQSWRQLR